MNEFKFLGTITHILPTESGVSKSNKDWKKLQFVVKEEKENYPQSMVFTMMDAKKIENFEKYNKVGHAVEVSFNLSAREYNGKWYADVTAWSVFSATSKQEAHENIKNSAVSSKVMDKQFDSIVDDDLPF